MYKVATGEPCEEFVALGNKGYGNAVDALKSTIENLLLSIKFWNDRLCSLGEHVEGEDNKVSEKCREYMKLVEKETKKIEDVKMLQNKVTKNHTTPKEHVIGFLLHSEKIEVSIDPGCYTNDWALIELYEEKIDWSMFKGTRFT